MTTDLEFTEYDAAGRAWRTNSGDGVVKINLFDVHGRIVSQVRSQSDDKNVLLSYADAEAVFTFDDVLRTEYRYDLMGRTVDTASFNLPEVLRYNSTTAVWEKLYQTTASGGDLIVVSGFDDKDKALGIDYREKGSTTWRAVGADRIIVSGNERGFKTEGLSTLEFEYRVTLTPLNEPGYVVAGGVVKPLWGSLRSVRLHSVRDATTLDR